MRKIERNMLLNSVRNGQGLYQVSLALLVYKLASDFKKEAEYLREPHEIMSYIDKIDFAKLKNSSDIGRELLKQLSNFEVKFDVQQFGKLDNKSYQVALGELDSLDFSKDIIRGQYQEVSKQLFELQDEILANDRETRYLAPPAEVKDLLFGIMKVTNEESLLDFCAGNGSLGLVVGQNSREFFGQDLSPFYASLANLNLILANKKGRVFEGDSLLEQKFGEADVVVSSPPFGMRAKVGNSAEYLQWGVPSKMGGDFYFLSLALSSMGKRGALVFPEGALFRSGKDGDVRQAIVESNLIEAVIALPPNLFAGTVVATSILVLNKHKKDKTVLMINAKSYFEKVRGGVVLSAKNLEKIVMLYKPNTTSPNQLYVVDVSAKYSIEGISRVVSESELKAHGFVLTVNKYVVKQKKDKIGIGELEEEVSELFAKMKVAQKKTDRLVSNM